MTAHRTSRSQAELSNVAFVPKSFEVGCKPCDQTIYRFTVICAGLCFLWWLILAFHHQHSAKSREEISIESVLRGRATDELLLDEFEMVKFQELIEDILSLEQM